MLLKYNCYDPNFIFLMKKEIGRATAFLNIKLKWPDDIGLQEIALKLGSNIK